MEAIEKNVQIRFYVLPNYSRNRRRDKVHLNQHFLISKNRYVLETLQSNFLHTMFGQGYILCKILWWGGGGGKVPREKKKKMKN